MRLLNEMRREIGENPRLFWKTFGITLVIGLVIDMTITGPNLWREFFTRMFN